jgi:hypothetical protein
LEKVGVGLMGRMVRSPDKAGAGERTLLLMFYYQNYLKMFSFFSQSVLYAAFLLAVFSIVDIRYL